MFESGFATFVFYAAIIVATVMFVFKLIQVRYLQQVAAMYAMGSQTFAHISDSLNKDVSELLEVMESADTNDRLSEHDRAEVRKQAYAKYKSISSSANKLISGNAKKYAVVTGKGGQVLSLDQAETMLRNEQGRVEP